MMSWLTMSFSLSFRRTSARKPLDAQLGAAAGELVGLGELEALLLDRDRLV